MFWFKLCSGINYGNCSMFSLSAVHQFQDLCLMTPPIRFCFALLKIYNYCLNVYDANLVLNRQFSQILKKHYFWSSDHHHIDTSTSLRTVVIGQEVSPEKRRDRNRKRDRGSTQFRFNLLFCSCLQLWGHIFQRKCLAQTAQSAKEIKTSIIIIIITVLVLVVRELQHTDFF